MDSAANMTRDNRAITRLATSHDASHFLLTPIEVATPRTTEDVATLMRSARRSRIPLTFRAGGTSISGQALTSGTLVDVRKHFRSIEVLDDGLRVRVGTGTTLRAVNTKLARYGRRLGPDPTSDISCTIGGIIANNSSGMLAGNTDTAYHTIDSMVFVLPSGRIIDTAKPDADIDIRIDEGHLVGGLHILRNRLRTNPQSIAEINRLFSIKNTMGYNINALTEFHRPIDIITHLLIGSEGTLGFVAEATFHTVPLATCKAAALAVFPTLGDATDAAQVLASHGFDSLELIDVASLRIALRHRTIPEQLRDLDLVGHAALVLELHDTDQQHLEQRIAQVQPVIDALDTLSPAPLTTDPAQYEVITGIRHGLFALVAAERDSGTTTLLGDICVPLDQLTSMCQALDKLIDRHGYGIDNVPLFAHAADGNIHFLLSERFDDSPSLIRYRKFNRDLSREVLRRGGTLKAEHGTGRAMAPFVEAQYGDELYGVMREIKHLFDPAGILNPGVIITDDPDEHLRNLKLMPTVEEEVDRCIECGFCETVCPSANLTLTPRQRIVLRRELVARRSDTPLINQINNEEYTYNAVDTCATDSLCALACPIGIDTGDLVRNQRSAAATQPAGTAWNKAARSWGIFTKLGSAAFTAAQSAIPVPRALARLGRKKFGPDAVPALGEGLPTGSSLRRKPSRRAKKAPDAVAAYFPSCVQAIIGTTDQGVFAAFNELCVRADVTVRLLDAEALCCGSPWHAKGLAQGHQAMRKKVLKALADVTIPIVSDASSCTAGLQQLVVANHQVLDVVEFAADQLLPKLSISQRLPRLALHPTCSSTRLGLDQALRTIAEAIADDVVIPDSWGCCGFAGDRGLLHPELPAAATAEMSAELAGQEFTAYASLNRTCELAMTQATGKTYLHIVELLAQVTR